METIKTDGIDIRSWCPNVDDNALAQMGLIARLPYVKEVCLMPDGHLGQNMCIGGVVATDNVVVPDFVGADIGCGMCAIKTNLTIGNLNDYISKRLFDVLSETIPVGSSKNNDKQRHMAEIDFKDRYHTLFMDTLGKDAFALSKSYYPFGDKEIDDVFYSQLGTLGSGNHFLEIQADENNNVWVMIHSGSRNMGKVIGDFYNQIALDANSKWHANNHGIPFLPVDTVEGKAYLTWMEFALGFAYFNRLSMMDTVISILSNMFNNDFKLMTDDITGDDLVINIHHNYASLENHHGKNVWVHRKGATKAYEGLYGIIPGSMGTSSYIVKGKGNHLSLNSCSHGAGRKMGRMQFSRWMENQYDRVEKSLEGILHTEFGEVQYGKNKGMKDVSEAPGAYKDIDEVMSNQEDLVEAVVKLRPLICVKG